MGEGDVATRTEAVVIGGGFAGVTAARELSAAGYATTLLEARERLGGRTWTTEFAGVRVDLGAGWVHWRQPHMWAELTRYGIEIVDDDWAYDVALFGDPPRRHPPDAAFTRLRALFRTYAAGDARSIPRPYDPLLLRDEVTRLDALSMQDRLDELDLSADDRDWLTGLLYEIAGSPLDEAALTVVLRWLALCDWDIDGWYDTNRFRPVGGTAAVIDAMVEHSSFQVELASPVEAIAHDESGVRVLTTDGRAVEAEVAVVAVPVNVWPGIDFSPSLPPGHAEAARVGMGKPHQDKVWIHVRGDLDRIFAQLPAPAPLNFFWTYAELDGGQLIIGINASPELDVTRREDVAKTIRGYVPEIEEVVDVRGQCWSAEEYTQGGNTCLRPGQLTQHLEALQRPWGRLAFATADIANGWTGYMEGAIESGIRAGRDCRRILSASRAGRTDPRTAKEDR